MGAETAAVGIAGAAYHLPRHARTTRQLAAEGLIAGDVATLETFGFLNARLAAGETHVDMAIHAARRVLDETDTAPEEVDLVLYAGALASSSVVPCLPPPAGSVLHLGSVPELFRYPAPMLQNELDLTNAVVCGVGQQGCAATFAAIQMGRSALLADPDIRNVLCVASDRLPDSVPRDVLFNLVSDGACAVLLRRGAPRNRILAYHQVTKPMGFAGDGGGGGDSPLDAEVIAAYFPTAARTIEHTLHKARLTMDDVAWIIPHNVSVRSWEILLGMIGAPPGKLFSGNIARVGHTIAADTIVNLRDAEDAGVLHPGDRLLLFTFGFGLNWACMVLEH